MSNKSAYWVSAIAVGAFSVLPYVSARVFPYSRYVDLYNLGFAVLWAFSLLSTIHFAKILGIGRWWFALSAPVALFRVGEFILTMLFFLYWRISGKGL